MHWKTELHNWLILWVIFVLTCAAGVSGAETADQMATKVDTEYSSGNVTESTKMDLKSVLDAAQAATTPEEQVTQKEAYNALVVVMAGISIQPSAASRLIWP